MKKYFILLSIAISFANAVYSQSYKDWDYENVEEFYEKVNTKNGTLGDDGRKINLVLIPTDIDRGIYEVEITDFKNDLYEIKGTDYYIKFRGYYGYAGYGDEGVLEVGTSAWSSTFYKKP